MQEILQFVCTLFEISPPVPGLLKKEVIFSNSAFYSVHSLFKSMQLFRISCALKFDPDVTEIFCVLPLKAEIHAVPVAIRYIYRRAIGTAVPVGIHLGRLKTTAWQKMG
jgi:hypothetical protein